MLTTAGLEDLSDVPSTSPARCEAGRGRRTGESLRFLNTRTDGFPGPLQPDEDGD
ncbi:hypothetical protein GCM10011578_098510 [Streptomyces fuscichromogenes]|uniref:Uncharacterized protein n=1 Tax=Streptomyces fuscichromogenes TaxID=1324013 RepID=A0A918CXN2_9ACTN|nr:hypothetical protein GCM10011578_098510 [Streptomyces fuscichromogenes]